MKSIWLGLISISTVLSGAFLLQDTHPVATRPQDATAPFMRAKLVGSQDVLDGLVTENFRLIHRGAADMKKMSLALQWPRAEDKVYEHYGEEFRRQCDKLMHLAEQKNLEGAHFTYLNMTTTCINCHNYVRGAFRVQKNVNDPQGPIRLIPTDWEGHTYQSDRQGGR